MRQRMIIVPKDVKAERALDYNEVDSKQLIELLISEEEFLLMYQSGIIELINNVGGANIDDFEDDSIVGKERISKVIRALSLKIEVGNDDKTQLIIGLLNLFKEAYYRGTGVFFYF